MWRRKGVERSVRTGSLRQPWGAAEREGWCRCSASTLMRGGSIVPEASWAAVTLSSQCWGAGSGHWPFTCGNLPCEMCWFLYHPFLQCNFCYHTQLPLNFHIIALYLNTWIVVSECQLIDFSLHVFGIKASLIFAKYKEDFLVLISSAICKGRCLS